MRGMPFHGLGPVVVYIGDWKPTFELPEGGLGLEPHDVFETNGQTLGFDGLVDRHNNPWHEAFTVDGVVAEGKGLTQCTEY